MQQPVELETYDGKSYIASRSSKVFVRTPQDILDIFAWGRENGADLFLLVDTDFPAEFYDLKTGLAGEILQNCSNYQMRTAIVGSFDVVESKRFRELMAEANKGPHVHFARNEEEVVSWLVR